MGQHTHNTHQKVEKIQKEEGTEKTFETGVCNLDSFKHYALSQYASAGQKASRFVDSLETFSSQPENLLKGSRLTMLMALRSLEIPMDSE